ncbi:MAG: transcriptional repressor NrdR [Candidatus Aenigmarchaeota archaeon]|nr:transcriptional repressor NrdR [Candidatus Aenigmarchaeota archaeon]NIQ18044.1 transcriptional repressor NrdR [Candidatus Aenigmarchaeota archaeon]
MRCPYCMNEELKVIDKRESDEKSSRRRRECLKCGKRFTTYERIESADLIVVKKSGERERFDRDKLKIGILKACEKRPITNEMIEKMIDEIETELRSDDGVEIPSKRIGQLVMKKLKKTDKVAYIRFASVYREFQDVESFENELRRLGRR